MGVAGNDLANEYQSGRSITSTAATSSVNGASVDFQDCGAAVTVIQTVGANPGNDTTMTVKLQDSADNTTFADITGATMTAVAGDEVNSREVKTFFTRSRRYVRAVATIAGSSPAIDVHVTLMSPKQSY